jgi:hypothetical protein
MAGERKDNQPRVSPPYFGESTLGPDQLTEASSDMTVIWRSLAGVALAGLIAAGLTLWLRDSDTDPRRERCQSLAGLLTVEDLTTAEKSSIWNSFDDLNCFGELQKARTTD